MRTPWASTSPSWIGKTCPATGAAAGLWRNFLAAVAATGPARPVRTQSRSGSFRERRMGASFDGVTLQAELALLEQGVVAVAGERLGAALLAVDDRDDAGDLEADLLDLADRLEGRSAGRHDVLEDDDAGAAGDLVLDDAPRAVVLGLFADQEGAQRPGRGGGAGRGRASVGRPGRAPLPGEPGDEVEVLGIERDPLAVEEHLGALPGGEDKIPAQHALLGDQRLQPGPRVHLSLPRYNTRLKRTMLPKDRPPSGGP